MILTPSCSDAQSRDLRARIRHIAADAQGRVSVACSLPGMTLRCDLDASAKPPMQSVFKLPLALTVLHRIDQGSLSLDDPIRFLRSDRILPETYSPLQDKYPDANVDVPVRELLRLAVALSDNVAADILLRTIGGPREVTRYIASLGITGFHLESSEHDLRRDSRLQYRNWLAPVGAVQLLRRIGDRPPLSPDLAALLMEWMKTSVKPRLKAGLPAGVDVFHKAGTSTHATNDIGLIQLPDGRSVAVAVFLTDSVADETTREKVIARIGRVVYEAALAATEQSFTGATMRSLEDFSRQALHKANASGFVHVRDVRSGGVLAHVSAAAGDHDDPSLSIGAPVAPLSVIKVYVAAVWLEHGFGDTALNCAASARYTARRMMVDEMLRSSCDSAGGEMAVILRNKIGAEQVLRDLRRFGLEHVTLKPDATDSEWGRVLSLGEEQVPVTAGQLSAFLAEIGRGGGELVSKQTAGRLLSGLDAVVQSGTATSIRNALANTGWHIGGKTGTGPGECGDRCDGWFASIVSDRRGGRYVILVFIRGGGLGGGIAARTAARVAQFLVQSAADGHNRALSQPLIDRLSGPETPSRES